MSAGRRYIGRFLSWTLLAAGATLLWIALSHFDRLGLLDVYHLPEYRRFPVHRVTGFYLPLITGLLSLIAAAILFLRAARTQDNSFPSVVGSRNRQP